MKFIALPLVLFSLNAFASQNNHQISILNKTYHHFSLQCNGKLFSQKLTPRKYHSFKTGTSSQTRQCIALFWLENNRPREVFFAQSNIKSITLYSDQFGNTRIDVDVDC